MKQGVRSRYGNKEIKGRVMETYAKRGGKEESFRRNGKLIPLGYVAHWKWAEERWTALTKRVSSRAEGGQGGGVVVIGHDDVRKEC